jgi:hypothetical protein
MCRIRFLVFAMLAGASAPVLAAPCAGFTDVDTANPGQAGFCPSVEWIRNRSVTAGCGGTNYCPDSVVTRLAMAAFMRNLGMALTPIDLPVVGGSAGVQTPGALPVVCATADYTVTGFPRRAYVNTMATLSAPSANIDVQADVVYSINPGPWTPVANGDQYTTLYAGATPPDQSTLAPFGSVDLNVGQTVRFGIRLSLEAGSGTVNVACSTRAQIANRNGTSTPFDAAPSAFVERPHAGVAH